MIVQREITGVLKRFSRDYPVVTITGPRQSGKTTLARTAFPDVPYFSFEDPDVRVLAESDPRSFLEKAGNRAILDEIQRIPKLISYLQGIVDSPRTGTFPKFILTGSCQFELMGTVTQSLAGRTALIRLLPFSINETRHFKKNYTMDDYLLTGFYPRIYDQKLEPYSAYKFYFETYIQRDLRQLIAIKDLRLFQKFVRLCAGRVGCLFSASALSNEVGVSVPTINSWISVLEASYIIFFLEPWYANIGKRLIKSPKLYFHDVGLAAYLLGIENGKQLERDPARGGLFENMVVSELMKTRCNIGKDQNLYFYRDSNGNEVDVLFQHGNRFVPVEIKSAATYISEFLKGLRYLKKNIADLIDEGFIVYSGDTEQAIGDVQLINWKNARRVVEVE